MQKADDDIGNLHAGVVDVVLDVDFLSGGAEQADEGVAEDGVAQVADVRGLVGIDAGVFDEGVNPAGFGRKAGRRLRPACAVAARSRRALM